MRNKKVLPLDLFLPTSFFLFPTCYVALTSIYRKCCRRFLRDSDNSAKIEIKRALPFQHGKIMFKCFGCRSWNINHVKYVGCLIVKQEFVHSTWMVYTWKMTEPTFMQYVLQHFQHCPRNHRHLTAASNGDKSILAFQSKWQGVSPIKFGLLSIYTGYLHISSGGGKPPQPNCKDHLSVYK